MWVERVYNFVMLNFLSILYTENYWSRFRFYQVIQNIKWVAFFRHSVYGMHFIQFPVPIRLKLFKTVDIRTVNTTLTERQFHLSTTLLLKVYFLMSSLSIPIINYIQAFYFSAYIRTHATRECEKQKGNEWVIELSWPAGRHLWNQSTVNCHTTTQSGCNWLIWWRR